MTTRREDGGPAFPVLHTIDGNWVKEPLAELRGMTLRDWFAGQALCMKWSIRPRDLDSPMTLEEIAKNCYRMADAMIQQREGL